MGQLERKYIKQILDGKTDRDEVLTDMVASHAIILQVSFISTQIHSLISGPCIVKLHLRQQNLSIYTVMIPSEFSAISFFRRMFDIRVTQL